VWQYDRLKTADIDKPLLRYVSRSSSICLLVDIAASRWKLYSLWLSSLNTYSVQTQRNSYRQDSQVSGNATLNKTYDKSK